MVVFPLQGVCEVFDNPLTQVLLAAALLASVDLELVKIAVSEGPHLDASLFTGFSGMYYFKVEQPVNLIIASSTTTSWWGS